jgi:hypothetical protein
MQKLRFNHIALLFVLANQATIYAMQSNKYDQRFSNKKRLTYQKISIGEKPLQEKSLKKEEYPNLDDRLRNRFLMELPTHKIPQPINIELLPTMPTPVFDENTNTLLAHDHVFMTQTYYPIQDDYFLELT